MDGLNILIFGQLEEITGTSVVAVPMLEDTVALVNHLHTKYPALKNKTFNIAVNQKLVTGNTMLQAGAQVALLPPFSGG